MIYIHDKDVKFPRILLIFVPVVGKWSSSLYIWFQNLTMPWDIWNNFRLKKIGGLVIAMEWMVSFLQTMWK